MHDALEWLFNTFGAFPFAEEGHLFKRRSFAAFVASPVGVFAVNLLPPGAVRPLVLAIGNQPGVGKSLLIRAILAAIYGYTEEDSKPKSDEELRNILDAVALQGSPYLFLDDVHNLASGDLNSFSLIALAHAACQGGHVARTAPEFMAGICDGNHLRLAEDLPRRSVVIFLLSEENASEREIASPITNTHLFSTEYRACACAASWALLRHWRDGGLPKSPEARLQSFEAYAEIVGNVCITAGLANPFASIGDWPIGGDDAARVLEAAVCKLAATRVQGQALTTIDILDELRESDTIDDVFPFDVKDEKKSLGHKLKRLRGRKFTAANGRRFEFGKGKDESGSRYGLHFVDQAKE